MPGRDGFWLVREVRALGLEVPAVAVTGIAAPQPTLTAGYKAFLEKPIDPEALFRVVAEVAGKRA
jgi:CheY-like chemotaxis protein